MTNQQSTAIVNEQSSSTQMGAAVDSTERNSPPAADQPLRMDDTISSLDELRSKAPQVYDRMLMGIAMTICSEMRRRQDRLKQIMRNNRIA